MGLTGICVGQGCGHKFRVGEGKWVHRDHTKMDDTGRPGDFGTQSEEYCEKCQQNTPRPTVGQEEFHTFHKASHAGSWTLEGAQNYMQKKHEAEDRVRAAAAKAAAKKRKGKR